MEKPEYDCVMFDFFGTLVPNFTLTAQNKTLGEIAAGVGVPSVLFIERWFGAFRQRATGEWPDTYSAVTNICNEFGVYPDNKQIEAAVSIRIEFTRNNIRPREDAVKTLSQIKKLGLKLGLISDCSPELPYLWDKTEFSPYFDATVFSCEHGTKKPDPLMYEIACDLLNVAPARCLYIGDGGSRELTGALNAGMHPVLLYDHNEQGSSDANRMEGEDWNGRRINKLSEVPGLLYKIRARAENHRH